MTQSVGVDRDEFAPGDLVSVTLVWDATLGSPPELAQYGGKVVAVPPTYLPLPQRGSLFGLHGYARHNGDGSWSWILQGDTDPVAAFVDALTGRGGWTNQVSRATTLTMIQRLFSAGIPRSTIASQIPQFYAAIAAEVRAEDALPPSP